MAQSRRFSTNWLITGTTPFTKLQEKGTLVDATLFASRHHIAEGRPSAWHSNIGATPRWRESNEAIPEKHAVGIAERDGAVTHPNRNRSLRSNRTGKRHDVDHDGRSQSQLLCLLSPLRCDPRGLLRRSRP